ncbi:conserved membrane hypothetical protein [Gammaproteobacteria bacterium]
MKKWSLVVAGLYGLVFLILIGPLAWIAFLGEEGTDWLEIIFTWQIWAIVSTMIVAQYVLLRVPVLVVSRRPVTKRSIFTTIIAAAFMMAILFLGAAASIVEFINKLEGGDELPLIVGVGLASWVFWVVYFYSFAKTSTPENTIAKLQRAMLTGSILELLIAIPTHIIARQRDYCCAGILTFIGIISGLSVMLFAFGPAIYFLFAERWQRLHPKR